MALPLPVCPRVLPRRRGRHEPRGPGRRLLRSERQRDPTGRDELAGGSLGRVGGVGFLRERRPQRADEPVQRLPGVPAARARSRCSSSRINDRTRRSSTRSSSSRRRAAPARRSSRCGRAAPAARRPEDLDGLLDTLLPFEGHFRDFTVRNFNSTLELPASERHYQGQDEAIPANEKPNLVEPTIELELPVTTALGSRAPAAAHRAVPALQGGRRRPLHADRQRRARERGLRRPRRPRERARHAGSAARARAACSSSAGRTRRTTSRSSTSS